MGKLANKGYIFKSFSTVGNLKLNCAGECWEPVQNTGVRVILDGEGVQELVFLPVHY